jgi:hypothetical protein
MRQIISVSILMGSSCKKITAAPSDKELVTWTAKLQDSLRYTVEQVEEITFYNGSRIYMSGGFFSISSFVENGVVIIVDTTEERSRQIDPMTEGKVTKTPERDPGSWVIKAMHVTFTKKNGMAFEFEYSLDRNGNTVLNKKASVTFEGKTYAISAYNTDSYGNVLSTTDKLLLYIQRRHVVLRDHQQ